MIAAIDPPSINIVIIGNSGVLAPPLPDGDDDDGGGGGGDDADNTFTVPTMFGCN